MRLVPQFLRASPLQLELCQRFVESIDRCPLVQPSKTEACPVVREAQRLAHQLLRFISALVDLVGTFQVQEVGKHRMFRLSHVAV